jgi:hypothetical protein
LIISMEDGERLSLEQVRALVEASGEVRFHSQDRGELYEWVNRTLRRQDYGGLNRGGKGLVRRYIAKMTGLSRAQTARLIRSYQQGREVKPRAYRRHRFAKRYTRADIEVLAAVDDAHETLSGPATQKVLQRAWHEYHDAQCERLARRWRSSIGCERAGPTAAASPINLPDPRRWRSENVANPIRKGGRDICAWTPCIKAT